MTCLISPKLSVQAVGRSTGCSASAAAAWVAEDVAVDRMMGTLTLVGAVFVSGSKSGTYIKSIVEESLTAFKLRLVLK
jgi:hypothetical protein